MRHVFEIQNSKSHILFFGVVHSRDPLDKQWGGLKNAWENFNSKAKGKKIIFFEGPKFEVPFGLAIDEQIRKYGEAGLLLSLVLEQQVELYWPEITLLEEANALNIKFEPDLVNYFIFVRTLGAWLKGGALGDFGEVTKKAVRSTASSIGSSEDFSYYSSIHKNVFGRPLTQDETTVVTRAAAPVYKDSVINEIGRTSNFIRDNRLVSEIHRFSSEDYSVFVLFGAHHARTLEDRIRREFAI